MSAATHTALAGNGYDYNGGNFARLSEDTAVRVAPAEYARPQCVIAYRVTDNLRMHIQKRALREVQS